MNRLYVLQTQLGAMLQGALRQFRNRQLESFLIVVAIALGVAVVTAVAAFLDLGRQAEARYQATLESRELTLREGVYATPFPEGADVRKVVVPPGKPFGVGLDDLARVQAASPSVDYAYVYDTRLLARAGQFFDEGLQVLAVTQHYLDAARVKLAAGSFPAASDFADGRNVLLITPRDMDTLQLAGNPVGQRITFDGMVDRPTFTIIGVLDAGAEHSLVPYLSFGASIIPGVPPEVKELRFAVADQTDLAIARAELQAYALSRWGQHAVVRANEFSGHVTRQQRTTGLIIAAFASLGLMVASLNIMNLMLARVFKRSRDIGVLRSLGATRAAIRGQVLTESLLLGLLGGLVGVGLGFSLLRAYNHYIRTVEGQFSLAFSPVALLVGLGIAVGLSLLFGLYPAVLASRVRPVMTLREA